MNKINFFTLTLLSAALVACGGGSGSPDKPDLCGDLGLNNCDQFTQPSSASSSSISPPINDILPFNESFTAPNATEFFHYSYKSLLNPNSEDLNNAFYYSTSGLDSGRVLVGDGKMTIGNARFTIGQRLQTTGTHLNPNPNTPYADYKVNTTTAGDATGFPTTQTWGELDLTNPWKISFCVREFAKLEGAANNQQFMVYIDNNQSISGASIHGSNSLAKEVSFDLLEAGKRVEITFPGEVRVGGVFKTFVTENVGTTTSFIQLRVPSAGVMTMSDLWIGYQANTASEPAANTCTTGERLPNWNVPMPPEAPVAPTFEPGNNQLRVSWPVASRATSYTVAYNTVDSLEGATLVTGITGTTTTITGLENGTSYHVFIKAINNGGESAYGPSAVGIPELPATAPETPTDLVVYGDSQRALVTWAATDGAESYSLAVNTQNETTTATVTDGITDTYKRLTGLVNNTPYYVFVKAGNAVGDSAYTAAQAVTPAPSPFIYQANFAVTKDLFFGTNGPAVQTLGVDSEVPMHFIAGGGAGITLEEGGIRLASGGRFTIGQAVEANADGVLAQTNTAASDTVVKGVLDLSGYYKVVINVVSAPDNAGLFQVYLDNNTTSGGSSIHQTTAASRLINRTANTITDGEEIVFEMNTNRRGTSTSFIQLRVDGAMGAEGILISGIRIEAMDAPIGGSSSEASSSAPSSVAPSSSSVTSSSSVPASSSSVTSSSSSVEVSSSSSSSSSEASSSSSVASSAPSGGTDVNTAWASFDPNTYISILSNPVASTTNNAVIQSSTAHSVNGLNFFHSATGTLRHRGGSNLEWNFNGTGFASGDPVAAVGAAAEEMRAYIGVPVDAGRAVTITVVHRNSTSAGTALGSIVFVGSDENVLAKYDAKVGTATTTTFSLPAGHTQTEVKFLFSREGGGAGGMHVTSIDKTYN